MLELHGVSKRFGTLTAVADVDFHADAGEIVALLGENGAGKSTLMKVVNGLLAPDAGSMTVAGKPVQLGDPRAARAAGVGMVFQQFSLIPAFTVAENLMLAWPKAPPLWWGRRAPFRPVTALLHELVPEVDPHAPVSRLTVGQKQLVELAKALNLDPRVLVLDEPTSVLGDSDGARLWQAVRAAAARGVAVVLITHKFDEMVENAQRVVVMRAGRIVDETRDVHDRRRLVQGLMGTKTEASAEEQGTSSVRGSALAAGGSLHESPVAGAPRTPRLTVRSLRAAAQGRTIALDHLDVHAGEILGVGGAAGQGQDLFARVLVGLARPSSGQVERSQTARDEAPAGFIPEQPVVHGCVPSANLVANLSLLEARRLPFWKPLASRQARAEAALARFDVRPREPLRNAGTLSGGNLQKLVVARELGARPSLLVACYPTMGLDLAATASVITELRGAAADGAAVVWIGEDVDLLLAHAHRVGIFHAGRLRGPVAPAETNRTELGAWMVGAA